MPVIIDPTLRPLPEPLKGMLCSCCDKPGAMWILDEEAWCSSCFLYRHRAMIDQEDEVRKLADLMPKVTLDAAGHLLGEGADRLVSILILTEQTLLLRRGGTE